MAHQTDRLPGWGGGLAPPGVSTLAQLNSPTFTGVPAAPTAAAGASTTQLATTAFATTADNLKANSASPTFTGVPAAPTAAAGTSTTQLATTAFVATAVGSGGFSATPQVIGARAFATNYTNSFGKPVLVKVRLDTPPAISPPPVQSLTLAVGGVVKAKDVGTISSTDTVSISLNVEAFVPVGAVYQVTTTVSGLPIVLWEELI